MAALQKYWLFIILALAATILVALHFLIEPPPTPEPEPKKPASSWESITPGKTTESELVNVLGQPSSVQTEENKKTLTFIPQGGGPDDRITISGNRVVITKRMYYGEETLETLKTKYGEPEGAFFGPYQNIGAKVYVFPKNGIAIIASTYDGTIIDIWNFNPATLPVFLSEWGQDLTTEEQPTRF